MSSKPCVAKFEEAVQFLLEEDEEFEFESEDKDEPELMED